MKYKFNEITQCCMCQSPTRYSRTLGIRMNGHQRFGIRATPGVFVSIMKCSKCGLVFSSPQPIPLELAQHYDQELENYFNEEQLNTNPLIISEIISKFEKITQSKLKNKFVLDVGTGAGTLALGLISEGATVTALEPSKKFYEKSKDILSEYESQVINKSIEEVEFEKKSFDLVILSAVLEHLPQPEIALQKIEKWLKPNGVVYITVPNANWLISNLINSYFKLKLKPSVTNLSPMHPPYHLFEFSQKSFEEFCLAYGRLEIADIQTNVGKVMFFPKMTHKFLSKLMARTKTGAEIEIYLRKISSK